METRNQLVPFAVEKNLECDKRIVCSLHFFWNVVCRLFHWLWGKKSCEYLKNQSGYIPSSPWTFLSIEFSFCLCPPCGFHSPLCYFPLCPLWLTFALELELSTLIMYSYYITSLLIAISFSSHHNEKVLQSAQFDLSSIGSVVMQRVRGLYEGWEMDVSYCMFYGLIPRRMLIKVPPHPPASWNIFPGQPKIENYGKIEFPCSGQKAPHALLKAVPRTRPSPFLMKDQYDSIITNFKGYFFYQFFFHWNMLSFEVFVILQH